MRRSPLLPYAPIQNVVLICLQLRNNYLKAGYYLFDKRCESISRAEKILPVLKGLVKGDMNKVTCFLSRPKGVLNK